MEIFVAHDFTKPPLRNYRKPFGVVAKKHKVEFKFADDIHKGKHLLDQIDEAIVKSTYCLFDVSSWNPNVLQELGFARGRAKDYSILFRPGNPLLWYLGYSTRFPDLPSDIKGLRQIRYWSPGILRVRLEELVRDLTSTGGLGAAEDMWITRIDERLSMYPDGLLMRQIAEHLSISAPIARGFIQKMIRDGIVEARGYGPSTRYVKIAGPRRAA